MERKDLVVGIKKALDEVTKVVVSAMNELRVSMNEKVSTIVKARQELADDYEMLTDIAVAVDDFVVDMSDIAGDIDYTVDTVGEILDGLDYISTDFELGMYDKEEEEENGDDDDDPADMVS